ncbi:hypothetical protein GCM10027345_29940 [Hymenobacter daeguensis]
MLALSGGYAAVVLHSATWDETQQLNTIFPFYHWKIRVFTPAELLLAKQGLALVAAAGGIGWIILARMQTNSAERATHGAGTGRWATLPATLGTLAPVQQRVAVAALAALTATRLLLSLPSITPLYDDAASYALFASKGLLQPVRITRCPTTTR